MVPISLDRADGPHLEESILRHIHTQAADLKTATELVKSSSNVVVILNVGVQHVSVMNYVTSLACGLRHRGRLRSSWWSDDWLNHYPVFV